MANPTQPSPAAPEPLQGGSGGELRPMAEQPNEELASRLSRQNKAIARVLKDPANAELLAKHDPPKRSLPMFRTGGGGVISSPALYERMDNENHELVRKLDGRDFGFVDAYRAYKHTPHQPASVFLKYLVHRIDHIDEYEDPKRALQLDADFLAHHKKGGAAEKNGHLVSKDLHVWMHAHPSLPEQLLVQKTKLHADLAKGVGLNIRDIGGEKYVALTRGLRSDIMDHEHALSSWADKVNTGFGSVMHHAWVPLKDLWYSYEHGPVAAGGDAGHENEFLVANTRPRYEATPEDVKSVRSFVDPFYWDNATDEQLARVAANDPSAVQHKNAGPKTLEAVMLGQPHAAEHYALSTKFRTREQALASPIVNSAQNPNLTTEDLTSKAAHFSSLGILDSTAAHMLLTHPAATTDTARAVMAHWKPGGRRDDNVLNQVAESPLSPPDVLDAVLAAVPSSRYATSNAPDPAVHVLGNPNSTTAQADRIAREQLGSLVTPHIYSEGRFSAQLVKEMSDVARAGQGPDPRPQDYIHGANDPAYRDEIAKRAWAARRRFDAGAAIAQMGSNRMLDEDAQETLVDVAEELGITDALGLMARRQNYAPLSESMQLRLLRALDNPKLNKDSGDAIRVLASSKGLAPSVVMALAVHHEEPVRTRLFTNKHVPVELLEKAWPSHLGTPEKYSKKVYNEEPGAIFERRDPYYELASALIDRRSYAARKAKSHLIRPWPVGLAKSEWWPLRLREWLSGRSKGPKGYYLRVPKLDQARAMVKDSVLPTSPTDEVLDGYVVMAHPAEDHYYHEWENDPGAGEALVYFETDSPPQQHEGKVYWPHDVVATEAKLVGIRPQEKHLAKAEDDDLKKMAIIHDDPVKPRTVWRVENEQGYGPYTGGAEGSLPIEEYEDVLARPAKHAPPPKKDFLSDEAAALHDTRVNKVLRFGFERPEHAQAWFGPELMQRLASRGYVLRERPASQVWRSKSGKQVFFIPHRPLAKAEEPEHKPRRKSGQYSYRNMDAKCGKCGSTLGDHMAEAPHDIDGKCDGFKPEKKLKKNEPLTRGPAFNGEKDYRPDEAQDPQWPIEGGPHKESSYELPALPGEGSLEGGELATARAQLGHRDRFELVLAAACFLGRRRYDPDKFQQGLAVFGDEQRAALHAVDLSDSDKNLRALDAVIALQDGKAQALSKAEGALVSIHSVQPGNEDAVDAAEAVRRAAQAGSVRPLKLNGKHSKGAMAARDPKTGKVYLLKPPGGKQSPAAGARDGKFGQMRREALFWHIADQVHLGGVIPHADLVLINAQEWAAISLLGSDWKPLDERNREKDYVAREVLGPYQANGQLSRWAILDGVLSNTDSHGQNVLVNNGGSLALIDHGAAFAGPKFDPAHDTKSFIPYYLRVWGPGSDFKKMTPEQRVKVMPRLPRGEDEVLKKWLIEDFTPAMVEREMRKYGADEIVVKAVLGRLERLRSVATDPNVNLSDYVNGLWAGLSPW